VNKQKQRSPSIIKKYIPGIKLFTDYETSWWRPDIIAAMSLWAILVPQSMAYAKLAGVPAVYGLYTAFAAMIGYAIFGTSRVLNQGPESAVAIVTAATLLPLVTGDGDQYILMASVLAILVGLWAIVGGILKLGFITRFISRPILLGYIVGSAWLIVISQLPAMLGMTVDEEGYYSTIGAIVRNLDQANLWTVAVGIALMALIYAMKKFVPKFPAYLAAAVIGTLVVLVFNLEDLGVTLVGSIEPGVPLPKIPFLPIPDIVNLILPAAGIALLAYADSVVTAESLARPNGYEIDADQEFIGLGAASIASGFFQGFPVNGSQTRSVVLDDSGAKSQMSGLISAVLVIVTLLLLTPAFEVLPNVALAAIVMVAGIGLFDVKEMRTLWRIQRADFILMVLTALGVIVIGMLPGILIAVLLSLLDVARRSTTPHTAVLVQVPGTDTFRDVDNVTGGEAVPGLLIYRFDAPLFFANVSVMTDEITRFVEEADSPVEWVLIDAESIHDIDTTAVLELEELLEDLNEAGIHIVFARLRQAVRDVIEAADLIDVIGDDNIYLEVDDAVTAFEQHQSSNSD
jgi:SulP family sulfate permease